jgi:hypothetical protein
MGPFAAAVPHSETVSSHRSNTMANIRKNDSYTSDITVSIKIYNYGVQSLLWSE